jgi:DNA sulfur modification protein DndB
MVPYLISNPDHFYSALTVEIRPAPNRGEPGTVKFVSKETFPGGPEFGTLTLDGTEALYALDGQHRLKSIELAVRQNPELARDHISLILVPYRSLPRSQSLFSDLNRYAKAPSKSIALLFTHRESFARMAKTLAQTVPLLRDRVNMESTSLSSKSRHFVTLSTLYEMTKVMVAKEEIEQKQESEAVAECQQIWDLLTETIEQWGLVAQGKEHPAYLRQRYLNMHGVAQQAIAVSVARVKKERNGTWARAVRTLGKVDWQLGNSEWQGVALHGGRVNNTATSIRMLASALEQKMGLATNRGRVAVG